MLFWGSVFGITGYRFYSKNECKKQMEMIKQKARELADQPMSPQDLPRKVIVIATNQPGEHSLYKTNDYWKKYILPVFTAGALDYELVEIENRSPVVEGEKNEAVGVMEGKVHEYVNNLISNQKRKKIEEFHPELKQQRIAAINNEPVQETAPEPESENWKSKESLVGVDIIAIGRNSFAETINGLSEGLEAPLDLKITKEITTTQNADSEVSDGSSKLELSTTETVQEPIDTEPKLDTESSPEDITDQTTNEITNETTEPKQPEEIVIEYEKYRDLSKDLPVPAVGYLPIYCLTGWRSIPLRMYRYINDIHNTTYYSEQALKIVYENKRKWIKSMDKKIGIEEEKLKGWEEKSAVFVISEDLEDNLVIYDTY
ncbi:hypothetical protein BB558_005973 [Smittium angustum]|nr:hypothetical protein BB558_005973 [Smittium angustum]